MPSYPEFPGPYATQGDLAAYWRALTDTEQARATVLLGAAADRINELPGAANFTSSARHWVSLDVVKRAMIGGGGEKSESQAMLGMSVNRTFVNPTGDLYITAKEVNRLRGRFGQSAGSVVLSSHARVPMQPWNFQRPHRDSTRIDWMRLCPDAITLTVGAERHMMVLAATWSEYEDRTDYALFTTSNAAVATVDNDGLMRAVGAGSATITATYEGFSDSSSVTVA